MQHSSEKPSCFLGKQESEEVKIGSHRNRASDFSYWHPAALRFSDREGV